ncbi:MAG: HAD hydrolase family protein [Treponema sp.]|nr:HAD hydrolase family protein [Treponema sp.]
MFYTELMGNNQLFPPFPSFPLTVKGLDPRQIQVLALDLDGTCLGLNASLSGRMIRAIRRCIDRGVRVIICTGRSLEAAEPYRQALGAEGPMVYFNGAEVVDMPSGKVLRSTLLRVEVADYCVDLSRSRGVYYQVYFPACPEHPRGILLAEQQRQETEQYRRHTGVQAVIGDLKQALAQPGLAGCVKGMFIGEPAFHEELRRLLTERFGRSIYIAQTSPTYLELMDAGVSKGIGLGHALAYLGLQEALVMACGDEENDLPLFAAASFAAAPATAKASVRAAADILFGPHTEDGLAEFLERLFE